MNRTATGSISQSVTGTVTESAVLAIANFSFTFKVSQVSCCWLLPNVWFALVRPALPTGAHMLTLVLLLWVVQLPEQLQRLCELLQRDEAILV